MATSFGFDSNTWYRFSLVASGTAANLSLDVLNNGLPNGYADLDVDATGQYAGQYWQISKSGDGYHLCTMWLGPNYRLGYYESGSSTAHPALFPDKSSSDPSLEWLIKPAQDGNSNGIYVMSNSQQGQMVELLDNSVILGGQGTGASSNWLIQPAGSINNATFSSTTASATTSAASSKTSSTSVTKTTATGASHVTSSGSATNTSTSSTSSSSGTHISTGTAAGIGVGCGVAVILLVAALMWYLRRRRRRQLAVQPTAEQQKHHPGGTAALPELPEDTIAELDNQQPGSMRRY